MGLDVYDPDNRLHQRHGVWQPEKGFAPYPAGEVSWFGAILSPARMATGHAYIGFRCVKSLEMTAQSRQF